MSTAREMLDMIGKLDMRKAVLVCHLFMEKVERDGGIAAVQTDLKSRFGNEPDPELVKHAMTCGASIILMMVKEGIAAAKHESGDTPAEKEDLDAQRQAQDIIARIRKLH